MKRILNSKTIFTIICLIVCGVVIVFAYNSRVNKKINKVTNIRCIYTCPQTNKHELYTT